MSRMVVAQAAVAVIMAGLAAGPVRAEIAVSANDAKVKLNNGTVEVVRNPQPDTISIIELAGAAPRVIGELPVPASVVGPPLSVAITPNEEIALVTGAMKIDPADPAKQAADDKLTVIEIGRAPGSLVGSIKKAVGGDKSGGQAQPKVLATLQSGLGAAGVSINKAGTLALVANRNEGTVSIFTIAGKTVAAAGKVDLGNPQSGPSHVAFLPDGKSALVSRDNDHKISELKIDGTKVEYTKRDMSAGLRPSGLDISSTGDIAVVANIGPGTGDSDTVSVIDLKATPSRVVNTVSVGPTPEGIKLSPDGKFLAVAVMNGSNKPKTSPFFKDNGLLVIYARVGATLSKVAEAPIGHWCQGIAWSRNARTILVQCMVEEEIQVFSFSGITAKALKKLDPIRVKGGPAGIRTAEK